MMMDPVKYGLFPMRKAIEALLQCCAQEEDVQGVSIHAGQNVSHMLFTGIQKVMALMKQLEMDWTGREHYLLAKVSLKKVLREKGRTFDERKGIRGVWVKSGGAPGEEQGNRDDTVEEQTQVRAEDAAEQEEGGAGEGGNDEAVEREQQEMTLGDLETVLDLSKKAYSLSENYGKKAFYSLNGLLLSAVSLPFTIALQVNSPGPTHPSCRES